MSNLILPARSRGAEIFKILPCRLTPQKIKVVT